MLTQTAIDYWQQSLRGWGFTGAPKVHIVLGSGFGSALSSLGDWDVAGEISFKDIPGFHSSSVQDHAGLYRFLRHRMSGKTVCFQLGRIHGYEGHAPEEIVCTVMLPRLGGTNHFFLTNAAGGLGPTQNAGDIMMIRDHVNLTGRNPLVGPNPRAPNGSELGPRFPDLTNLYDRAASGQVREKLITQGLRVHEGIYLGVLGPSFETPAEVRLFQAWGMGAVGMSTVWEAIALGHSGAKVSALSLISNLGAGLGAGDAIDHAKVLETSRLSAGKVVQAFLAWLEEF